MSVSNVFSFKSNNNPRGYCAQKETIWNNAKEAYRVKAEVETSKLCKNVNPCTICPINEFFHKWKTFGHILQEPPRHAYYLVKSESGSITGIVISTTSVSNTIQRIGNPVPNKILVSLKKKKTLEEMRFVSSLYDHNYTGNLKNADSTDDEKAKRRAKLKEKRREITMNSTRILISLSKL